MFLRPSTLNALMKQAYKGTGLIVAKTEEYLYIAGYYWETEIKNGFIQKKTMGDLITLVGELPDVRERYKATKDGNQMEMNLPMRVRSEEFGEDTITVTDLILIGTNGTKQRLLQDENTGQIYAVNEVFMNIVDNDMIEYDKGEYMAAEPFYDEKWGIMWANNVCKFRAHFRSDDKNIKIFECLKGVDITPEVAGEISEREE